MNGRLCFVSGVAEVHGGLVPRFFTGVAGLHGIGALTLGYVILGVESNRTLRTPRPRARPHHPV